MSNLAFFLSSTFNDMQSERDLFREKITPEIESRFARFGYNIEFIDLRWGIDTKNIPENDANQKILRTCFDEIRKSSPFFIALIGERYGWIPDGENVDGACRDSGLELTDEFIEKSVTELEIACALHTFGSMDRCLFYFRDSVDYGGDSQARELYVSRGTDAAKVEALKRKLKERYPGQVRTYKAEWDAEIGQIVGLEGFERQITEDIDRCLRAELGAALEATNDFDGSLNVINGLRQSLSAAFAGRESELERIFAFIDDPRERLMVLSGNSGCGKSSIMAKAAALCEERGYNALSFFAGADEACSTAENMLKILTYRLCALTGATPCFDGGDADIAEVAAQFNKLLSLLSLSGKTVLFIDAVNQFAKTAYEEKLKWLNLYAVNPAVKIILSCTDDYYQLKYLKALNAVTLDVDYFSDGDILTVTKRYFKVNHKEANPKLLAAIAGKRTEEGNPCRKPLYLMTLLQELNNIGADDFKSIKKRESAAGESAADAIINYLAETAEQAPVQFDGQLLRLFEKVKQKVGAQAGEIFACAIATGRRGVTERFIEKLCRKLGCQFDSANFSYFKKLLKNDLCQRENGAWDFNHALVKEFFEGLFASSPLREELIAAAADSLKEEDDGDQFKRAYYLRYLALAGRAGEFAEYFSAMKDDAQVANSLVIQLREEEDHKTADALLFPVTKHTKDIWDFLERTIAAGYYLPAPSSIYANKALNGIYSGGNADFGHVFALYSALGAVAVSSGYYAHGRDYLQLALRVAQKADCGLALYPVYNSLATCYFNLGNGFRHKKYSALAERELERLVDGGSQADLPALLCTYLKACGQKLKSLAAGGRAVKNYVGKAYARLENAKQLGAMADSELALWYSEILRVCGEAAINSFVPDGGLEEYAHSSGDLRFKSRVLYNLGVYWAQSDLVRAKALFTAAAECAEELLKTDDGEENLLFLNSVLSALEPLEMCAGGDGKQLRAKQYGYLNRINAVSPQYETVQRQIALCENKERRGELVALRKGLARGYSSADQRAANKIIALIAVVVLSVFLLVLPLFYSVFRSQALSIFRALGMNFTSAYNLFFNFYIMGALETLQGLALYFALFGVLQIFNLRAGYKLRSSWIKRSVILLAAFALIAFIYFFVYVYAYGVLQGHAVSAGQTNIFSREMPYCAVLFSGFILLVVAADQIFSFVAYERPTRNRAHNCARFYAGFKKNLLSYAVCLAVTGLAVAMYFSGAGALIKLEELSATDAPTLCLSLTAFGVCAGITGGVIAAKIIYLTAMYIATKVKYGKIFKG